MILLLIEGTSQSQTLDTPQPTGVPLSLLQEVGEKIVTLPEDLTIHRRLKTVMQKKRETVESGKDLDWATGEALAFGTLLREGNDVRLSGQDVERGTFSHRHAVLHDQNVTNKFVPLSNIHPEQATFTVTNSNLSEFGVLGFELGYALEDPKTLVLWEAQFGDFFNGAQVSETRGNMTHPCCIKPAPNPTHTHPHQNSPPHKHQNRHRQPRLNPRPHAPPQVIVDQFLSSQEDKWARQSGLVMLLPHGYEGQGPEHSSARMERFLQMANDHPYQILDEITAAQKINMQVANCTTPASYFHILRRQVRRNFRKPLVIMTPKSLLRHPQARSSFDDMAEGTFFQPVLAEESEQDASAVKRVVLCSGKVYYDIIKERQSRGMEADLAVIRVEQVAPFPHKQVAEQVAKYPNADLVWCQEEHMNMGAWAYVEPRIETAVKQLMNIERRPRYVGRAPAAATAAGSSALHERELNTFMEELFTTK